MEERDLAFRRAFNVVHDGFVTPHRLTGLPGKLSGCVYQSDGSKVDLSERFGGYMRDHAISDNPDHVDPPQNARRLPGRGLYLGHYMAGHYGHFITEGLSTFWIFEDMPAEGFDYFLFHPFNFGDSVPAYAKYCFDHFGISTDRIMIVGSEPLTFEELVVPERLLRLNHSADPRARWPYRDLARAARLPAGAGNRLYFSRRLFNRRKFDRVVANEVQVERAFAAHGFQIVYPETLSFETQVALCNNADIVAGMSGSGLHNSLFMRPGARLIELGDPRYVGEPAPTQGLCNIISGVKADFVPFVGRRFGERWTLLFDLRFLRKSLQEILGPPVSRPHTEGVLARLHGAIAAMAEVLFLSIRPSAGAWARRLLRRQRDESEGGARVTG